MSFKKGDKVGVKDEYLQLCKEHGWPTEVHPNRVYTVLSNQEGQVSLDGVSRLFHYSHFEKLSGGNLSKHISYSFNESTYVSEIRKYIDKTYSQHYASKKVQTGELIYSKPERGLHFSISNIIKYADRFGDKKGMNRSDLYKICHYAIHALYCLDALDGDKNGKEEKERGNNYRC
ncbi:DUF3310 domain-containing protein [Zooshikella ganghwensis]|uniref:DUF3310 domain-containing protein n=1 Tax=Zooshikella ganghwensis TaxID=202772 RepID=UPI0004251335|nr:DUF3310 domain-containing protein [Zooshikella ganghwensis]